MSSAEKSFRTRRITFILIRIYKIPKSFFLRRYQQNRGPFNFTTRLKLWPIFTWLFLGRGSRQRNRIVMRDIFEYFVSTSQVLEIFIFLACCIKRNILVYQHLCVSGQFSLYTYRNGVLIFKRKALTFETRNFMPFWNLAEFAELFHSKRWTFLSRLWGIMLTRFHTLWEKCKLETYNV